MDLMNASRQWATRPPDQRFSSLQELLQATVNHRKAAVQARGEYRNLTALPQGEEIMLKGNSDLQVALSSWAFSQLCSRAVAPAAYLRTLPAAMACTLLNYGLQQNRDDSQFAMLLSKTDQGMISRAILSPSYSRIWNFELVDRLMQLPAGWRVPPARPAFPGQPGSRPATLEDVLQDQGHGLSVKVGDMIAPAGLYASFEDMFVFLINETARIDDGTPEGLSRGFFLRNSEVGKNSLSLITFMYRHVCGNHIVWGASHVRELNIRHVGAADERFVREVEVELKAYSEASASEDEALISSAKQFRIAASKDAVIDLIFKRGILSRVRADEAYQLAERHEDNPQSAWGFAQGVTRMSQLQPNADARVEIDRAASKVLELAF